MCTPTHFTLSLLSLSKPAAQKTYLSSFLHRTYLFYLLFVLVFLLFAFVASTICSIITLSLSLLLFSLHHYSLNFSHFGYICSSLSNQPFAQLFFAHHFLSPTYIQENCHYFLSFSRLSFVPSTFCSIIQWMLLFLSSSLSLVLSPPILSLSLQPLPRKLLLLFSFAHIRHICSLSHRPFARFYY